MNIKRIEESIIEEQLKNDPQLYFYLKNVPEINVGEKVHTLVVNLLKCDLLTSVTPQIKNWQATFKVEWLNKREEPENQKYVSWSLCKLLFDTIEGPMNKTLDDLKKALENDDLDESTKLCEASSTLNEFHTELLNLVEITLPKNENINSFVETLRKSYAKQKVLKKQHEFITCDFPKIMEYYNRLILENYNNQQFILDDVNNRLKVMNIDTLDASDGLSELINIVTKNMEQIEADFYKLLEESEKLSKEMSEEDKIFQELLKKGMELLSKRF